MALQNFYLKCPHNVTFRVEISDNHRFSDSHMPLIGAASQRVKKDIKRLTNQYAGPTTMARSLFTKALTYFIIALDTAHIIIISDRPFMTHMAVTGHKRPGGEKAAGSCNTHKLPSSRKYRNSNDAVKCYELLLVISGRACQLHPWTDRNLPMWKTTTMNKAVRLAHPIYLIWHAGISLT